MQCLISLYLHTFHLRRHLQWALDQTESPEFGVVVDQKEVSFVQEDRGMASGDGDVWEPDLDVVASALIG